MKKCFLAFMVSIMLACFFPVCVYADSLLTTYFEVFPNNCVVTWRGVSNGRYRYSKLQVTGSSVRYVAWKNNPNDTGYSGTAYVSDHPFYYNSATSNGSNETCEYNPNLSITSTPTERTFEGVTYYVATSGSGSYTYLACPVNYNDSGYSNAWEIAIYYTYGDGAVEPSEPINWGLLKDVTYQTAIAGQGSASTRNVDYLKWETAVDANGNDISECEVEIQAVPGNFSGTSLENITTKTLNDLELWQGGPVNLGTVRATQGTFSVSWSAVLSRLGLTWNVLSPHLDDSLWKQVGWYYQIRLVGSDGYVGQWQTLYTPLVQSSQASQTVINATSYSMSLYQIYEQLTQINNQTSIEVTFQEVTYIIQNPDDGDEPQEGVDYWDILKQMLNGIIQIVGNIQKLPQFFSEKVQEFVTPQLTDGESLADRFDAEYQAYMEENQPTIWDMMEDMEYIKEYVYGLAPEDQGAHVCILQWEDVEMDLTDFNAGNVVFISGGEYNLTLAFLNLLHAFDMTYADYEFYVSSVIYLWLCVFIFRHFIKFLDGR